MVMDDPAKWFRDLGSSLWAKTTNRIAELAVSLLVAGAVALSGLFEGIPLAVLIVLVLMAVVLALYTLILLQRWRFKKVVDAEKRQERKDRIERWREFVSDWNFPGRSFSETAVYSEMKPYLRRAAVNDIQGRTLRVMVGLRGRREMILDEITRLEHEWDLI